MSDLGPFFDEHDEQERIERRIKRFYGEFADETRAKLLAKNVVRPENVYDVMYPRTREHLLSKNKPNLFSKNLDEGSKAIRDQLLSKNVSRESDLLNDSEDIRKNLEARIKINKELSDLLDKSKQVRETLLSKNIERSSNLLISSEELRRGAVAKNKPAPPGQDLASDSEDIRIANIAKTIKSESDLKTDSEAYREANTSKDKSESSNLELDSEAFRKNNLSKNETEETSLERDSEAYRQNNVSKNKIETTDLETLFEGTRKALLGKNKPESVSLEDISAAFREALLSVNVSPSTDLLTSSDSIRKDSVGRNKEKTSNLLEDSDAVRLDALGKNTGIRTETLDSLFSTVRRDLLGQNKVTTTDLLTFFDETRKNLLGKNVVVTSDLESDSKAYRDSLLGFNKPKISDLEADTAQVRKDTLALNKPKTSDLEADTAQVRKDLLGLNKPKTTNLEKDSEQIRKDLLGFNKPKITNLETDSEPTRTALLGATKPKITNLETDSEPTRTALLGATKPKFTDLETDSEPTRTALLGATKPKFTDLETDSVLTRTTLLGANVPKNTDLETDSVPTRVSLLGKNVPNPSDLLVDSQPPRESLLGKNVPKESDLLVDSQPPREDLLGKNVPKETNLLVDGQPLREDLIAKNVPKDTDLLDDSEIARGDNVSKNISNNTNLFEYSEDFRDENVAKNVPKLSSLENDSITFRDTMLSRNGGGLLGINILGFGTSAFIGVSRVLVQGIIFRNILQSRNQAILNQTPPSYEIGKNDRTDFWNQVRLSEKGPIVSTVNYINNQGANLQGYFGNSVNGVDRANEAIRFPESDIIANRKYLRGSLTDAISKYNASRSTFNLQKLSPGDQQGRDILLNTTVGGVQDLISSTVGGLGNLGQGTQLGTNTTPENVIAANNGQYFKAAPERILKPIEGELGTATSMQGKTIPGNPFDDADFKLGRRGVRRIVNVIKDSSAGAGLDMQGNFDTQNTQDFVIGSKSDGSPRVARQRYSVSNPYAPSGAENLTLFFQNYSIQNGDGVRSSMFFPPYVSSFNHASNANWNSINFVGRPEPLYTYNYSTRNGSLSFFVLTDFAQQVDIGVDFETGETIKYNFEGKKFTQPTRGQKKAQLDALIAERKALRNEIGELNAAIAAGGPEAASRKAEVEEKRIQVKNINSKIWELDRTVSVRYSEESPNGSNVYSNVGFRDREDGKIVSKPEDTVTRLDEMKKNLLFQPAYFSGDKVDFIERIEYLEKMTRPSKNSGPGFSFIKPPVCHMHLGEYFNHDIIVNSISYDYTDTVWTLDGGKTQPMWANVTMNFEIVGEYRTGGGAPLLSDDVGGYFSDRKRTVAKKKTTTPDSAAGKQAQRPDTQPTPGTA